MESKQMPSLAGFTGTMGYHYLNFMRNLKFTDGWEYVAKELGAFWLCDIMASVQHLPKIKSNGFIVWRIVVKDSKAVVDAHSDCEADGTYSTDTLLYSQKLNYTDFPEGTFEWYQEGDVVLLKEEH